MSRLRLGVCAVLLAGALATPNIPARADDVQVNSIAQVANTGGNGLRLRQGPGTQQTIVTTLNDGVLVNVVDGPVADANGTNWYRVTYNGQTGWVAADYLTTPSTPPVGRALSAPVTAAPAGLAAPSTAATAAPQPTSTPAPSLVSALAPPGGGQAQPPPSSGDTAAAPNPPSPASPPSGTTPTTPSVRYPAPNPANLPKPGSGGRPTGASVTQTALAFLGTPYVWAGKSPAGFDCAGFVYYVFSVYNITLPTSTYDQWTYGRAIGQDDLLPGDLVFFSNTYGPGITHVGIYIGDKTFVHSENEGTGVTKSSLSSGYWAGKYYGARRVFE